MHHARSARPNAVTEDARRGAGPDYLAPYRRSLDAIGPAFGSLLYYAPESQSRRFEALAKMAPLHGRRVVDFGCGRGDLLLWLEAHGVHCARYLGLDAFPEFVEVARERVRSAGACEADCAALDFVDCDFERFGSDDEAVTFVFSGSLNLLSQDRAMAVLLRAFRVLARRPGNALAFNFLSRCPSYAGEEDAHLRRFDAATMVGFALGQSPLTVFCQHYLSGHDATISMVVPAGE